MENQSVWERIGTAVGFEKRGVPTATIGSSKTTMSDEAGTFEAPDRNVMMTGPNRFIEFDKFLRDTTIIASGTRLLLNLIANAVWRIVPPEGLSDNEKAVSEGYAEFLYAEIFGMTTSWTTVVKKTAMFQMIGFSLQEWTAERREDGRIGLKDIEHRPQRTITRWIRDSGGTIEAVVQRVPGLPEVVIPRSKLVYAVDNALTDSPEGMGLLRHCADTALRLQQFLDMEEVGFATDLRGIPIGRAPLGELQQEVIDAGSEGSEARMKAEARRQRMLEPLRNFIKRHVRSKSTGVNLPSDVYMSNSVDKGTTPSAVAKWMLEILNGDSTSFPDVAKAIQRMNQELARVLGAEHLLLGSDGSGSLALAKSKIGTFFLTVTSMLLDLVEVYDRDIIAPVAELNGWEEHLVPQMAVNEISDRDVTEVLQALSDLATAGAPMMPNDPAVGEIYDLLGLSRPPERDEADLSLKTDRKDPNAKPDPDDEMNDNPEDGMAKVRLLRSRTNMQKGARKWRP